MSVLTRTAMVAVACLAAYGSSGCGGSSSPSSPSPSTPPASGGATITITAAGVSPREVQIRVGTRVTFVNNNTRSHNMTSDPHPEHTDCPAINQVGFITPGQTKETGNFTTARTCGFHDHDMDTNDSLKGRIVVMP